MKINFKQPKYILPLLVLPFLCLFFYVWHNSYAKRAVKSKPDAGIQDNVGEASAEVKKKALSDKLDAFRNTYKEADGYTAVNPINAEGNTGPVVANPYNQSEQRKLDSIDQQMKQKFRSVSNSGNASGRYRPRADTRSESTSSGREDQALTTALTNLSAQRKRREGYPVRQETPPPKEKDPMELFKNQMAYMDSVSKSNDPQYKAELQKNAALAKAEALRKSRPIVEVRKDKSPSDDFNTVIPQSKDAFISAIIDENVTGYAGSRIRLRLLDDIYAGHALIKKGTCLYALVSGFQGQRVTLVVQSVLVNGQILPVKLNIYDQDGLPGLYVPASAFRDFTKDLSGNAMQGVTIDGGAQNGSQFLMSTLDKMFQSTSSAIASAIRKNKAKIKYNSYVYLIDQQALQNASQNN